MQLSVIKNAKRNIVFGTLNKLIVILCPFVSRLFINRILGMQYLGINSLFSSILDVLSLSELGFSAAILFFMYKPVSTGDVKAVNALLNLYKWVYRLVGIAILALGLCIMPFIGFLINDDIPSDVNIYFVYIVYVINSAMSYFLYAYMSSIIIVNQRDDISSIINSVTMIGLTAIQILLLSITESYYSFIVLMPVFTVIGNILTVIIVRKQFPMYHAEGKVPHDIQAKIKKVVLGAFIQKSCATTRNSIDSICISSFIGVVATGIYNNYFLIVRGITTLQSVFCNSLLGGIGNHVATKGIDENFEELKKLDFIYLNICGWCTSFLLCLYQPFMKIWMGEDSLLPFKTVVLLCIYFYILGIGTVRYMYMTTNGLFWEHRWRSIAETIINVLLNVILGKLYGIDGIIIATMISLLTCNFIWANKITFGEYFGKSYYLKEYYKYQLKYLIINACICMLTLLICLSIDIENVFFELLVRALICALIPGVIFFVLYKKEILDIKKILLR